jgi:hypothetical protein
VRPKRARYQAALGPDMKCFAYSKALRNRTPNLHELFALITHGRAAMYFLAMPAGVVQSF